MTDYPQGTDRDLGAGQGQQGGANGCRARRLKQAHGRAAEAGGWSVGAKSRLTKDHVGRGCGEGVI